MDELIIDERKYVSTKRASKLTGYAKDYVGQLCREGRVPARLVGRSWYVLEAAIQDHRFGSLEEGASAPQQEVVPPILPTWESPRYEATAVEALPTMRRTEEPVSMTEQAPESVPATQQLHEAWREWFSMRSSPEVKEEPVEAFSEGTESEEVPAEEEAVALEIDQEEPQTQEEQEDVEEVVPIRTIKTEPQEVRPIDEILVARPQVPAPVFAEASPAPIRTIRRRKGRSAGLRLGMAVGAFAAFLLVILAAAGTGYADSYVASLGQMSQLAGISVYNK